jgi:hypothetical protein
MTFQIDFFNVEYLWSFCKIFEIKVNMNSNSSKLQYFLIKKSIVLFLFLFVILGFIFSFNVSALIGLALGYFVSLMRLIGLSSAVNKLLGSLKGKKKRLSINYFIIQILTILVLIFSAKQSLTFFICTFVGVLTIPMTILINSIFELTGITKNNFE